MKVGGQILWNVYTYLRNVTDLLSDGKTPCERRFGQGLIIPFGSLVEYHPITAKDQSRINQFGKKVLPGLFLRIVRGWNLEGWRTGRRPWGVGDDGRIGNLLKTLNAKEVIFHEKKRIYFPIADGRIKPLGGDQDLRTSTLIRERQFEEKVTLIFLENQKGLFHHLKTHFRMPVKLWMIFGPCQETSYTAIT